MFGRLLPPLALVLVLAAGMLAAFPAQPALGQSDGTKLYVYIEELPDWAPYAANVMYESTKYWEEQIPGLEFYEVDDPSLANFRVQWVRDFGGERIGYALGSHLIEVGLGDSNCLDQWNPFSANHVTDIMTHEIGHVLGYKHADDPNDIMYPVALNWEYGVVEHELSFAESFGRYIPLCTSKQAASFDFQVSTDDPVYGFDVYFVPSPDSLDQWGRGQPFEHYADDSCFGEGYLQYGSTCEGVAGDGGLMIVTDDVQSNRLTTINVQLQEVSEAQTYDAPQPFPAKLQGDPGALSIPDSYNLFVDPQGRYTIQYPSTWTVSDSDFEAQQVGFYDHETGAAAITVLLQEDVAEYTSDELLDGFVDGMRDSCISQTYSTHGQVCYKFQVIGRDVFSSETGPYSYGVMTASTIQYADQPGPSEVLAVTLVGLYDGGNMWSVLVACRLLPESAYLVREQCIEPLTASVASFQLTRTSAHQTGQAERIPVPQEPDPGPGAPVPSAKIGNIGVDQDIYVLGPAAITTYAKISGTAGDTSKGDKIGITYTYPDGTTNGNLVHPTKDGYFEALLALDRDSPRGTYEVFASLDNQVIGIVTFEVTDRQPKPVPRPPVVDAQPAAGQASIPEWVRISAGGWAEGALDDGAFLRSIQYMINQGTIQIPATEAGDGEGTSKIPAWVRISAGWWAEGAIDDGTFVRSMQFLVQSGVMVVAESE